MSFFLTMIEATDANRREMEAIPKIHSMIHHGLTLPEYQAFLHDLYHVVWHFCPAMAAAASRMSDDFRQVRYELYGDIAEEQGHEGWVLEDIAAMGGNVDGVKATPPSAPVQAMIAFNYASSEREHPCAILGMLYTLEVMSSVYGGRVSDSIARALERDVEGGGFKFLSSHASMDLDHMAKLNRLVKTIEDPRAQAAIINSVRVNFYLFGQMFKENGFVTHVDG